MQNFSLSLPQTFLETARSVQGVIRPIDPGRSKQIPGMTEEGSAATLALAVSSISIIYSVLAVEAFANYWLYRLWKESRDDHDGRQDVRSKRQVPKAFLKQFYEEYGKGNAFEHLKSKKGIRELPDRINTICKYLPVIPIYEATPNLWQEFLTLLKQSRHFLVHPYPDPDLIQNNLDRMLTKESLDLHPRIAASVIRHFYVQRGGSPPAWVEKNMVFRFNGVEFPLQ